MLYLFHGEDEFSRAEAVTHLRQKLAEDDPAMADLNTTFLDGRRLTVSELRHACDTIPFMADRRLVIVQGLLGRLATRGRAKKRAGETSDKEPAWKRDFLKELKDYLPALPPTTRLVLVETKALPANNPILKLARSMGQKRGFFVRPFPLPKDDDLPHWIHQRTGEKGGKISHKAVAWLAALIGSDLRQIDQEIDKLLLYTDGKEITGDDVRTLVSRAREANIFDLVDAIGLCQTDRALQLLHAMLDDLEAPLYLLTMIARQIRILLQISELQELGAREIATRLKLHPFVAKKGLAQARNFDRDQLKRAHWRVVETDWAIKTGQIEDVLALDLLIVDLSRNRL